ncbi:DUF6922 domain-containing protein [Pedobacter sp. AW31-3R]|uniref:DUF6922 domain-containing protein n=1 Tax=Pedobacter sp. AW31-3R TaxID=3445781 RepID=UPI003F9FAA81
MYLLQAYSAIKEEKLKERIELHPDLSLFRKALFWDTDKSKLDWEKQYKPITFTVQRYPVESWAEHNSIPGSTLFLIDSGYRLCRMPNSMINVLTRLDRKNRQNYLATIVDH